jgi:hypothetical protein
MFHPLEEDLSALKDTEVEEKLRDLTKKYHLAIRFGNTELLTQISTFVTIYRNELSKRMLAKTQSNDDNDLDQLINVD